MDKQAKGEIMGFITVNNIDERNKALDLICECGHKFRDHSYFVFNVLEYPQTIHSSACVPCLRGEYCEHWRRAKVG